jgi:hypothetical protein
MLLLDVKNKAQRSFIALETFVRRHGPAKFTRFPAWNAQK